MSIKPSLVTLLRVLLQTTGGRVSPLQCIQHWPWSHWLWLQQWFPSGTRLWRDRVHSPLEIPSSLTPGPFTWDKDRAKRRMSSWTSVVSSVWNWKSLGAEPESGLYPLSRFVTLRYLLILPFHLPFHNFSITIVGDFNSHVDDLLNTLASQFLDLHTSNDLFYPTSATYSHCHNLNQVIISNYFVFEILASSILLSD